MCGIAGIVSLNPEPRIARMLESIEHRGRDDEGVWTSEQIDANNRRVCLGHRRLAIIDPSPAGHEPMLSHDGRYVLIFNGEIYNYRELREQLRARGHQFRTESDAEVLLAAIVEWGWDAMDQLNGMFAFAVWDNREKTLTLARDHVGIKPLYYAFIPGDNNAPPAFIFGSEIKAILASKLIKPALNPEALHQFLTFLWAPDPNTLFAGVKTVPPAHLLHFHKDELKLRQWWDVSFNEIEEGRNEAYWRECTLETLDRVVKMEMVADVPLGSFLSGGLDSSGITALMKRHVNGTQIRTYTSGIKSKDLIHDIIPDDLHWARIVSDLLKTDDHVIELEPSIEKLLPKLVYHMEEPPIDMAIPSYLLAQAAREKLKVMLSGMGGDEVFAGYPRQWAMWIARFFDPVPRFLLSPLMRSVANILPGGQPGKLTAVFRNAKKFARNVPFDFEERYLRFGTYFTDDMKRQLYSDEYRAITRDYDAYATHRGYFARVAGAAPLNRLLYVDLKTFLPCLNLMTTDKTSMAANLEVRVPFLNREMIEMAARMPPDLKLRRWKKQKYVLKRALEEVLPPEVVWRRKAGFGAPIRSWLRGPLNPLISDLLSEDAVKRRGLFQPEEVKRVIDANTSGAEDYNLQVFQLLGLELWHQIFIDSSGNS